MFPFLSSWGTNEKQSQHAKHGSLDRSHQNSHWTQYGEIFQTSKAFLRAEIAVEFLNGRIPVTHDIAK